MKILFFLLVLAASFCATAQETTSVVVFNIQSKAGVGQGIGDTLTEEILARLRSAESLKVSAMNEVEAALNIEQKKQMLGCNETSCFVEIAGALGTDYLVMGSVSAIGDVFALSVKLVNAADGVFVKQAYERFQSKSGSELFEAAEKAATKIIGALKDSKPKMQEAGVTIVEPQHEDETKSVEEETSQPETSTSAWVWVATSVAVAGLGTGVAGTVIYTQANSDYDNAKNEGVSAGKQEDIQDKGDTGVLLQNIGYSVAGAGVLAALLIYSLSGDEESDEDTASLNIAPAPFGLAVEGSF